MEHNNLIHNEEHLSHYLVLVMGLFLCVIGIVLVNGNREFQTLISFVSSLFYILWGIIHHKLEQRLTMVIALEYVLFGSFVFLLFFTALNL